MPGGGGMDGGNGFQYFGPMQQADRFSTFNPLQTMPSPMSPMSPMETMQPPRMDYAPPPAQKLGGNAYPSHPFVRSPRDFFMWGENMDDEIRFAAGHSRCHEVGDGANPMSRARTLQRAAHAVSGSA